MSFPSQSDPPFVHKDRNNEITIYVPPTRVNGRHRSSPKRIEPTNDGYQPTKFQPKQSIGLASTLGYNFLQGFARSHVARATRNRSVQNRYRLLSAVPAHRMNIRPSEPTGRFGSRGENTLADIQTYRQTPAGLYFSSNPPEEIFEQKPLMLKH